MSARFDMNQDGDRIVVAQEVPAPRATIKGYVTALLRDPVTKQVKARFQRPNIVTNAGDYFYAQAIAEKFGNGTASTAFARMVLGTAGNAPAKTSVYSDLTSVVAGSEQAFDSGYPQDNDPDSTNPVGDKQRVLTYRVTYAAGTATATGINRVAITIASPITTSPLLMYATFSAFDKGASDELVMFVNHTLTGS